MTTLSKKQRWFNTINLTRDDDLYVGVDTHKESFHVAVWLNDAPAIDFVMPPDSAKLIDTLNKLRVALRLVVYEAGPTGYSLARAPGDGSAPTKTPEKPSTASFITPAKKTKPSPLWPENSLFIYGKWPATINLIIATLDTVRRTKLLSNDDL